MNASKLMTQAGAARKLGIKTATISVLVRRGTLQTVQTADGLRLIPIAEVERYGRERATRTTPEQ